MALPADADIPLILSRIRPAADWHWRGDGSTWSDPADLDWQDPVQVEPDETEMGADWTAYLAEQATALTVKQQLKALVTAVAGSGIQDLTNAQVRDLVEVLVAIMGGVDLETRLVKPANQWTTARDILDI